MAVAQKSTGEGLGVGSFCGRLRGAGMGCSCPHTPSAASCRDAAGAAGHCGGCRGEDGGDDVGCGAAAGSYPAAGEGWSRAVPRCASPAPLQGRSTGRLACVHPLLAPAPTHGRCCGCVSAQGQHIEDMALLFTPSHHSPKYPPGTPHLHQPQVPSLLLTQHQPTTPFSTSTEKTPPALVPSPTLPARTWWDRHVGGGTGLHLARPSVLRQPCSGR